jgi:hypothetical protein
VDANPIIAVDANRMKGKLIIQDGVIIFDKVPIVTPNNDVLVSNCCKGDKPFFRTHTLPFSAEGTVFQSVSRHEYFGLWS